MKRMNKAVSPTKEREAIEEEAQRPMVKAKGMDVFDAKAGGATAISRAGQSVYPIYEKSC